jgi:hypothetical protein
MNDLIHLSVTGIEAGRRMCSAADGRSVHAAYAPLDKEQFRAVCCPRCLKYWADMAYETHDDMPDWVSQLREGERTQSEA